MTAAFIIPRKVWLWVYALAVTILFTTSAFTYDHIAEADLHKIRKLLVTALDSKKTTDSLYSHLADVKDRSALLNAYMGTLEALKAKHAWNPYFKVKYLNDSEKTFKNAVANDPHNIEIRFMRFSIEHNVPKFLGYNKNLIADREEMIKQIDRKYYSSADKTLVKTIINFLIDSKRCTPAENTNLKEHLAAL
ncbi:hypothetical protein D0C36_07425 [Mucilaginibacter conchicola]|uniref:Uncharacterized protein n=1 Tax=Mucilaginibacter conchicola TaxID=2303333 RepID=A0A372NZ19_9SPHI|nr:hypothetical protein [Mucilaginibacter conchicola]RFZ95350.1 hypothetical protein D0C36_07425 [Mucilaginibacter conchicola]